jgi:hypothetical protein
MTLSLPAFNLKKQLCSSWEFHVDERYESSNTCNMIIPRDLLGRLCIIMKFNDQIVTWETDTIPKKDRHTPLRSVLREHLQFMVYFRLFLELDVVFQYCQRWNIT